MKPIAIHGSRLRRALCVLCVLCGSVSAAFPRTVQAQSLAQRVAAARDGAVTFHFAARPGVCGDGDHFIRTGNHSYMGSFNGDRYPDAECVEGPVQVRIAVSDGAVTRVQSWVGPLRNRNARDIGAAGAAEAASYLMSIARTGAPNAAAKAIMPAVLADSAVVWPALLAIAKDEDGRTRSIRRDAMFWLSRYAGSAIAGHRNDPLDDDDDSDDPDDDLKRNAVFVLSQLPRDEGIPQLLEVARSNVKPSVRRHALFWLGQSGDPRALALFESVLKS